jgi:hypothetical protein
MSRRTEYRFDLAVWLVGFDAASCSVIYDTIAANRAAAPYVAEPLLVYDVHEVSEPKVSWLE